MNDNEQVLAELRKISAWADMQRKVTKWSLIGVAVFLAAILLFALYMEQRVKTQIADMESNRSPVVIETWWDFDRSIKSSDFAEAIRIGEILIQKAPQYPEGHRRLASAYLASGQIAKAREHYAEAFRLFPSEENKNKLTVIDKRLQEAK